MKKAFTLIELLVVVLIVGILAAIALPQYQKAVLKTRFVQLMVLQDAIWHAEQVYHLANNTYTSQVENLDISLPAGTLTYGESEDRSYWSSGQYSITISSSWVQGYFQSLSYVRYFGSSGRECRVYDDSNMKKGVCQSLGGVKDNCSSCNYVIYKF